MTELSVSIKQLQCVSPWRTRCYVRPCCSPRSLASFTALAPAHACACSGSIPEQWGQLDGLQVLRLRHNQLTGSLPPGGRAKAKPGHILVAVCPFVA